MVKYGKSIRIKFHRNVILTYLYTHTVHRTTRNGHFTPGLLFVICLFDERILPANFRWSRVCRHSETKKKTVRITRTPEIVWMR